MHLTNYTLNKTAAGFVAPMRGDEHGADADKRSLAITFAALADERRRARPPPRRVAAGRAASEEKPASASASASRRASESAECDDDACDEAEIWRRIRVVAARTVAALWPQLAARHRPFFGGAGRGVGAVPVEPWIGHAR